MKRLFTLPFILALTLLLSLELFVRLFMADTMSDRFEYGYALDTGFVESGDGTVKLVSSGGRRFRPDSFTVDPPEGKRRIFVIGDSVARGPSLKDSYPKQLEDLLLEGGKDVETFNLAAGGYGSHRKRIVVEKGLEYKPHIVILHVNRSNEFEDEREYKRSQEFKGWHPKNWMMKSMVIRRVYEMKLEKVFWKLLPTEIRNQKAITDIDAELAASVDTEKVAKWNRDTLSNTAESVDMILAGGAEVIIVVQAYQKVDDSGEQTIEDRGIGELLTPLLSKGVHIISMKDILEGFPVRETYVDGSHLTPEGHTLIAFDLVKLLEEKGLLDGDAGIR